MAEAAFNTIKKAIKHIIHSFEYFKWDLRFQKRNLRKNYNICIYDCILVVFRFYKQMLKEFTEMKVFTWNVTSSTQNNLYAVIFSYLKIQKMWVMTWKWEWHLKVDDMKLLFQILYTTIKFHYDSVSIRK